MLTSKDIKFPYYSGNIFLTKCLGHVSLDYFIKAQQEPKKQTLQLLKLIKLADNANNKELKRELKQKLYSFTPSVFIPKLKKRKYENIDHWTGLMQLDFDKLRDAQEAKDLKEHIFRNYKHIVASYLSPSGKGVKCLMKIKVPRDKDHYKAIHKTVIAEMEQYDCFDEATTNAMLPLFLSYDKDILYREFSSAYRWSEEDWSSPEYVHLLDNESETRGSDYYIQGDKSMHGRTVRIFENKIRNIISEGHPQVRSACLILGSRVGAGYISEAEARMMAESLVHNNSYLQKDLTNYKRTANWGISEGIKNPKYYE